MNSIEKKFGQSKEERPKQPERTKDDLAHLGELRAAYEKKLGEEAKKLNSDPMFLKKRIEILKSLIEANPNWDELAIDELLSTCASQIRNAEFDIKCWEGKSEYAEARTNAITKLAELNRARNTLEVISKNAGSQRSLPSNKLIEVMGKKLLRLESAKK